MIVRPWAPAPDGMIKAASRAANTNNRFIEVLQNFLE
jgi:hypothetical protein